MSDLGYETYLKIPKIRLAEVPEDYREANINITCDMFYCDIGVSIEDLIRHSQNTRSFNISTNNKNTNGTAAFQTHLYFRQTLEIGKTLRVVGFNIDKCLACQSSIEVDKCKELLESNSLKHWIYNEVLSSVIRANKITNLQCFDFLKIRLTPFLASLNEESAPNELELQNPSKSSGK